MSYLLNIHKEFISNINERQDYLFYPNVQGKQVKSDVMFEQIYRNLLKEKNRRTFVTNPYKDEMRQFKCESIEKVIEKKGSFTYFTPAVFWHHRQRTKEELIWLTCIILDFDFATDKTNRKFSNDDLAALLLNEFDLTPNFIWDTYTKGNKQACFLINPMTGTMGSIYLWESIVKRMAILTGADISATDSVHLFRIPKKGLTQYTDDVYDIDEFRFVFDNEEINKSLEKQRKEYNNVTSMTEHQVMKHESVEMLLNAEFEGSRNHAAFTIALLYYALDKDQEEVLDLLNGEWFNKVNEGASKKFFKREVDSTVKSAFSGKYAGPSKEWIHFLTGIEFPFNLWRSSYVKKKDEERIYQKGSKVRRKLIDWIRENSGKTKHQKELETELDIPGRTIRRQLKQLKEEGIINYETQRGRYSKGTTFEYLPSKKFEIEYDNKLKNELPKYEEFDKKRA